MLSRAGLRSVRSVPSVRAVPRAAARAAPLLPPAPAGQVLARRSVGGASDREPGGKMPKDVIPLVSAVSFVLILGLVFGVRQFKTDPTLRTHREDAVDREPTAAPPAIPEWDKSSRAAGGGGGHAK